MSRLVAPKVYRAPMRSRDDTIDPELAVQRALDLGVCGMGGVLPRVPRSLSEALELTDAAHGTRAAARLERFAAVEIGSLVWTRDTDGLYFVGRISGPWTYDAAPGAHEADLVHVRACEWRTSPVDEAVVPAATRQTFARGGRNFQQTHDRAVGEASLLLLERTTGEPVPSD